MDMDGMKVVLYSNDCPRCKILKQKLDTKQIKYEIVSDIDVMEQKGFMMLPMLDVNGEVLEFGAAADWVNKLG